MWAICNQMLFNFVFIIALFVVNVKLQKPGTNDNSSDKPTHPSIYNIGGVLSSNDSETHFANTISVSIFFYIFYDFPLSLKIINTLFTISRLLCCFLFHKLQKLRRAHWNFFWTLIFFHSSTPTIVDLIFCFESKNTLNSVTFIISIQPFECM